MAKPLKREESDSPLANFYALLKTAKKPDLRKDTFNQLSQKYKPFVGVLEIFECVRQKAKEITVLKMPIT